MMLAAAESAARSAGDFAVVRPLCVGITVLTSLDQRALHAELRVASSVSDHALHLAALSREAGLDGSVTSPEETGLVRLAMGPGWTVVTPGIRPAAVDGRAAADDDQKRTATPDSALAAGADYIVVGRPIIAAPDPAEAARLILEPRRSSRST